MKPDAVIGIVGPCASGKTTLVSNLSALDISAKNIAQEHSYVPKMWQILTKPDILIYLHVSYKVAMQRRNLNWTEEEYERQLIRLRHAQEHANLIILTDELDKEQVVKTVVSFLNTQ